MVKTPGLYGYKLLKYCQIKHNVIQELSLIPITSKARLNLNDMLAMLLTRPANS